MRFILVFCSFLHFANGQFAEIASIATSLLGSGLGPALGGVSSAGSAAAPGALGALSQIGQLYQLAQGALQLTGTGVGVLNQASEGNWFPAALETASKSASDVVASGPPPHTIQPHTDTYPGQPSFPLGLVNWYYSAFHNYKLFCALELTVIRINLSVYYARDIFHRIEIGTAGLPWQDVYLLALQPLIRCTAYMNVGDVLLKDIVEVTAMA
ncbi:unnamed protein product [Haemonchus placei]|uniref:Secreted protein n=1 Tax=Haemonchus placei TaxID=6290 RepID=A0A0N4W7M7_HAEPC|nr:unnamed protein product [Haemonchus placei]